MFSRSNSNRRSRQRTALIRSAAIYLKVVAPCEIRSSAGRADPGSTTERPRDVPIVSLVYLTSLNTLRDSASHTVTSSPPVHAHRDQRGSAGAHRGSAHRRRRDRSAGPLHARGPSRRGVVKRGHAPPLPSWHARRLHSPRSATRGGVVVLHLARPDVAGSLLFSTVGTGPTTTRLDRTADRDEREHVPRLGG